MSVLQKLAGAFITFEQYEKSFQLQPCLPLPFRVGEELRFQTRHDVDVVAADLGLQWCDLAGTVLSPSLSGITIATRGRNARISCTPPASDGQRRIGVTERRTLGANLYTDGSDGTFEGAGVGGEQTVTAGGGITATFVGRSTDFAFAGTQSAKFTLVNGAAATNILTSGDNGTFEANDTGWTGGTRTSAQAQSGSFSYSLAQDTDGEGVTTATVPFAANTTYQVKFWVRCSDIGELESLRITAGSALLVASYSTEVPEDVRLGITSSNTWIEITGTITTGSVAPTTLEFRQAVVNGTSTTWVDNVRVLTTAPVTGTATFANPNAPTVAALSYVSYRVRVERTSALSTVTAYPSALINTHSMTQRGGTVEYSAWMQVSAWGAGPTGARAATLTLPYSIAPGETLTVYLDNIEVRDSEIVRIGLSNRLDPDPSTDSDGRTLLMTYAGYGDDFNFDYADPNWTNQIRLPMRVYHPEYEEMGEAYTGSDGSEQKNNVRIRQTLNFDTGLLHERHVEALRIALSHARLTISGQSYVSAEMNSPVPTGKGSWRTAVRYVRGKLRTTPYFEQSAF